MRSRNAPSVHAAHHFFLSFLWFSPAAARLRRQASGRDGGRVLSRGRNVATRWAASATSASAPGCKPSSFLPALYSVYLFPSDLALNLCPAQAALNKPGKESSACLHGEAIANPESALLFGFYRNPPHHPDAIQDYHHLPWTRANLHHDEQASPRPWPARIRVTCFFGDNQAAECDPLSLAPSLRHPCQPWAW